MESSLNMKLNIKTATSYDIVYNTLLYTSAKFKYNMALQLVKELYGEAFAQLEKAEIRFTSGRGAEISSLAFGTDYILEKRVKDILLAEITKLSELEKVMYGL